MAVSDTTGLIFQLPEDTSDEMYQKVLEVKIEDLTTGSITGSGAFDKIMASVKQHLQAEYEIGRITGNEYTKAYIETTNAALQTALQFVLGREQAFWAAQTAQIQAITARVELEAAKYNYDNILPIQKNTAQVSYESAKYNYDHMLPIQADTALVNYQTAKYTYDYMLPIQRDAALYNVQHILPAQSALLTGQAEVQHAQISDTLLDGGTPVTGVMGAQQALYKQQVISYKRDAEVKAARIFTDAWITQKTIDDGLTAPPNFTNSSVDAILGTIKSNNDL